MIIDLTLGQVVALMKHFKWGDNSVLEGTLDTQKNEVILYGVSFPYNYLIPKNCKLRQIPKPGNRVIRQGEDYWIVEE